MVLLYGNAKDDKYIYFIHYFIFYCFPFQFLPLMAIIDVRIRRKAEPIFSYDMAVLHDFYFYIMKII